MPSDARLGEYHAKRSFEATPEPANDDGAAAADASRFVVQEHHATRLHWDLRLEHDGVLASWALPRGFPTSPEQNRLAVHTEDHPLEYIDFEGQIPEGNYGAGKMTIWDSGVYEVEKWERRKLVVRLHGARVNGRFALFQTRGKDWMIHRMDPPAPDHEPMPESVEPMKATLAKLPADDDDWGYEIKWDGVRALAYCEPGRLRLESRTLREITPQYPEIAPILLELEGKPVVLDGELVAFDDDGRPSFQRLQKRIHLSSSAEVRRRMADVPVTYMIFDLLYADGRSLLELPYEERRVELEAVGLNGASWQTPAFHRGDGKALLAASKAQGLEGIVAKRLRSAYRPGRRSRDWLKVKNVRSQELVIGGWQPGKGRRSGELGALLVGYHEGGELRYAGKVGTGFGDADLKLLRERLEPLETKLNPFTGGRPPKESRFAEPDLVAEIEFNEWTNSGTLRHPSYKGLRTDKAAADVIREQPA